MDLERRAFDLPYAPKAEVGTIITWTEAAVALILIGLRIYGWSIGVLRLRTDFWIVMVTLAFGLVTAAVSVAAFHSGVGWHMVDLTYPQVFACLKYLWIGLPMGLVATIFAKLAIVALLLQVTTILQPGRRVFLVGVGVVNTVISFSQIIISLTQCDPYPYLWARYLEGGTCPRAEFAARYSYFQGAVTGLVDVILALYPVTIAWQLSVSLKTKIGFCGLMAGGLLCVISPIQRSRAVLVLLNPSDFTYELPDLYVWCMSEMWVIMIIASIPPLRPLFLHWFWNASLNNTIRRTGEGTGVLSQSGIGTGLPPPRMPKLKPIESADLEKGPPEESEDSTTGLALDKKVAVVETIELDVSRGHRVSRNSGGGGNTVADQTCPTKQE